MTKHVTHIEIWRAIRGFEVRLVGPNGWTMDRFRSRTIEDARGCADAQAFACGNCRVDDKSGMA
jgi:hypothetical protein